MKEFSANEAIEMMHRNTSKALRQCADYIEKFKMDYEDSVKFLRESSDELEAQAMVVKLRDEINPSNT